MIVLALGIYELYIQIRKMVSRSSVVISQVDYFTNDPGQLNLSSSNFVFALLPPSDMDLSSSYLSFAMNMSINSRDSRGKLIKDYIRVPLQYCTKEYLAGFESDYEAYNLSSALCPSVNEYPVVGGYLSKTFTFVKLYVTTCVNNSGVNDFTTTCLPQAELDQIYKTRQIQIQLFYSENILNLNNFTHPFQRILVNQYWYLVPTVYRKLVDIFIKKESIFTDSDYLGLNGPEKTSIVLTNNGNTREQDLTLEEGKFLTLVLRNSELSTSHTRKYVHLSEVLASLGGLLKIYFMVFGFIVIVYTKFRYFKDVTNEIYEYEEAESDKQQLKKPSKAKQSKPELDLHDLKEDEVLDAKHLKLYSKKYNESSMKKRLNFRFDEFIASFLCPCSKRLKNKKKLYAKAKERMEADLDIILIIKKLQELDKIKSVLFDSYQQELLQYAPVPCIRLSKSENNKIKRGSSIKKIPKVKINKNKEKVPQSYLDNAADYQDDLPKFMKLLNAYRILKYSSCNPAEAEFNKTLIQGIDQRMKKALDDIDNHINNPDSELGIYIKQHFNIETPNGPVPIYVKIRERKEVETLPASQLAVKDERLTEEANQQNIADDTNGNGNVLDNGNQSKSYDQERDRSVVGLQEISPQEVILNMGNTIKNINESTEPASVKKDHMSLISCLIQKKILTSLKNSDEEELQKHSPSFKAPVVQPSFYPILESERTIKDSKTDKEIELMQYSNSEAEPMSNHNSHLTDSKEKKGHT